MANLNGTSGNDVINGTASDDTIEGLAGFDQLDGAGGNDILRGGDDADYLSGGEGDDILEGGGGDDSLSGGYGDDSMDGGDGNDYLSSYYGGDQVIAGGAGNDTVWVSDSSGGLRTTLIDTGSDDDLLNLSDYYGGDHTVAMGTGNDTVRITNMNGSARISLGAGRDLVELAQYFGHGSTNGSIVITDFAAGDSGDRLEFVDAIARLFGNWNHQLSPFATGHMRVVQSGAHSLLQFDVDGGGDNYVTIITFENVSAASLTAWNMSGYPLDGSIPAKLIVTGTVGDDRLYGAAGGDEIRGLEGNDRLFGGGGNDLIEGGVGYDTIYGQIGDDEIHGGGDSDSLDGGHGNDTIYGEGGNDYITSERGADILDGGGDDDSIIINRDYTTTETVTAFGGSGNDWFYLQSYGSGTMIADGGSGADTVNVNLLAGMAQVTLGDGADRLVLSTFYAEQIQNSASIVVSDFAPASGDVLDFTQFAVNAFPTWDGSENPFGAGFVRLFQSGSDTLFQIDVDGGGDLWRTIVTLQNVAPSAFTAANLGGYAPDGSPPPGLTLVGTAAYDNLTGGAGGDSIDGLEGDDFLNGGGGSDTLRGGLGNDYLYGGIGNDLVEGGDGDDFVDDGSGDDLIFGGEGKDTLYSNRGWDIVNGGGGDDTLVVQRSSAQVDTVALFAEEGNDHVRLTLYSQTFVTVDLGVGDDKVTLGPVAGSARLTLGAGADEVTLPDFAVYDGGGIVEITDFTVGADKISMLHFVEAQGWDPAANPFETGHARLVQEGADTLLQFDPNGGGDSYSTRLTFLGIQAETLGVASIGYDVRARVGGNSDNIWSYTSPAAMAGLTFDGGGGTDRLVLNGQFAGGLTFGAGSFRNMERIELGSAPAGSLYSYAITIADGNLAAGGLLTVAASDLRAGETLTFDGDETTVGRFAVTGGAGDDSILGGGGDDALVGGAGTDQLQGNGGNDVLEGGLGADQLRGNAGNDLLDGGAGADDMAGGIGNDIYVVDNAGDIFTEASGEGIDEIRYALADYSLVGTNFENLTAASDIAHDFRGNSGNNVITGGAGNDVLRLNDGGNDTVNGGAGNDNIFFIGALNAGDLVNGGAGVDTVIVQGNYAGGLTLGVNVTQIENVSILGGNNTNFGEPGTNRYDYVITTHNSNFAAGVQARINGSALLAGEDFTFNGTAETNASFVVYGGKGKDTLTGGLGNDIFFYAEERFATGDTVNGGAGYDGMFLRGNYTIDFNAPGYTGLFTNIENLTLTSATDERYARGGGTEFDYNLVLSNAIVGAGQELTVSGALLLASETMIFDASQETDGVLRLFGGAAADTLKGGALADLFHGAMGADTLRGGGGADVFRYQEVTESYSVARDHIIDFTPGTDKIELDRIDADQQILGGDQAFTWIGSNAFSNQAGQLRAFQSGAQWIVEGDINGDGYADLVIALTLQGPTPLGAGDFIL